MENNKLNNPYLNGQDKDKQTILDYILNQVEKGTGLSLSELKSTYAEDVLFSVALQYVTTTKKALCAALNIPVEGACWYKRKLEKEAILVQSRDVVVCPYTKHLAHLLTTNPNEFEKLAKSSCEQLNLFE